jgi:hypothetical protein
MPHNKLNVSGAQADILSWVNHELSTDEHNMLRNVSRRDGKAGKNSAICIKACSIARKKR